MTVPGFMKERLKGVNTVAEKNSTAGFVAGTFCGGCVQGSFAEKHASCLECDFNQMVQTEEGMANLQTKFYISSIVTVPLHLLK
jgi:hypothetical protein